MASVPQKAPLSSFSPLSALNGVGEKRVALYRKLGLSTIQDLTGYYPRSYLDFSHAVDVLNAPLHCLCTLRVRILAHHPGQYIRKGLTVYKVEAADDTAAAISVSTPAARMTRFTASLPRSRFSDTRRVTAVQMPDMAKVEARMYTENMS